MSASTRVFIVLALAACAPQHETRSNSSTVSTTVASGTAVRIDSVAPTKVDLLGPGLAELKIYGQGFVADSNEVLLDGVAIARAGSADAKYIRIVLMKTLPSSGGPPMTMLAGDHTVQVRNTRGTSNGITLEVQSP